MYEKQSKTYCGLDMRFLIGSCEQASADWSSASLVRVVYS